MNKKQSKQPKAKKETCETTVASLNMIAADTLTT